MPRKRKRPPPRAATAAPYSDNRKTGPVAVTYTAQKTCPKSCVLVNGGGCYAENGPIGMITARLNRGARGKTALEIAREEAALIRALPAVVDLRLHGVGDCSTAKQARVVAAAAGEYAGRGKDMRPGGVRVWTYTHAWATVPRDAWGGVSVLASCHSPGEAVDAMDRGYAAAAIVAEWDDAGHYESVGLRPVACPYQTKKVQCVKCRLCMDDENLRDAKIVILFKAHGTGRASVVKSLPVLGQRQPLPREETKCDR